ncbi:MAG: hypothetical protein HYV09_29980 [Deltaproteobacteria bacterium]|nr:hypothetical protein [Deltaproteobacteria bacterium]
MRALLAAAVLVSVSAEAAAQSTSGRGSYSGGSRYNARGSPPLKCEVARCALPTGAIVLGAMSSTYVVTRMAWTVQAGELPVGAHVAGALAGGLSVVTATLYATTDDPAPRHQTFGTVACLTVGVPALLLGLHGLITADAERDAVKPGPVPNWYGPSYLRVHGGPATVADLRGAPSPGLAVGGLF